MGNKIDYPLINFVAHSMGKLQPDGLKSIPQKYQGRSDLLGFEK